MILRDRDPEVQVVTTRFLEDFTGRVLARDQEPDS